MSQTDPTTNATVLQRLTDKDLIDTYAAALSLDYATSTSITRDTRALIYKEIADRFGGPDAYDTHCRVDATLADGAIVDHDDELRDPESVSSVRLTDDAFEIGQWWIPTDLDRQDG